MKNGILFLCLLLIFSAIYANPWTTTILSEVWFADNGHLFVELSTSPIYITNYNQVQIAHGDTIAQITQDIVITNDPVVIDVSTLSPVLTFDPAGDTLTVKYWFMNEYLPLDGVRWGYGEYDNIHPPLPGQSMVKSTPNYFALDLQIPWFKDAPPTPGTNPYAPVGRDTLIVSVTDQYGNPVPNVPIYNTNISQSFIIGYTNAYGVFADTIKAGKLPLKVVHPVSNLVLYDQILYLEPNSTTQVNVVIDVAENDDATPVISFHGLKAYPSPYNKRNNEAISFSYDGKTKLRGQSVIRIYDIKGRYVMSIPMSAKGTASWKPGRDISSGIYFARLISGNRIVDTTTITIIK